MKKLYGFSGDHDEILVTALKADPILAFEYDQLVPEMKTLLINGLKANFNIGQLVQGESTAAALKSLVGLRPDEFNLFVSHIFFDIAGALGHIAPAGSKLMTENLYSGIRIILEEVPALLNGSANVLQVYFKIMQAIGKLINIEVKTIEDMTLLRMAKLLGVDSALSYGEFRSTFNQLVPLEQNKLLQGFAVSGFDDGLALLPYYGPRVLKFIEKGLSKNGQVVVDKIESYQLTLASFVKVLAAFTKKTARRTDIGVYTLEFTDCFVK